MSKGTDEVREEDGYRDDPHLKEIKMTYCDTLLL